MHTYSVLDIITLKCDLRLISVLACPALLVYNDGGADPRDVLGPPDGPLPELAGQPPNDHHQRNGHPQLFGQRGLRQDVCAWRDDVST